MKVRASFIGRDWTYGARRVWHDLLAQGVDCGRHRIERLMRTQGLKARPRRRRLPPNLGERQAATAAPNVLDRAFVAPAPNPRWIADFTYIWTAAGWLYVAAVVDLFSRRIVGWSMSAGMTAQLVTDALVMAIWRPGKPDHWCTAQTVVRLHRSFLQCETTALDDRLSKPYEFERRAGFA